MSAARLAAVAIAAALSGATIATPLVLSFEGWELRAYEDVVNVYTACGGITEGVRAGQVFSETECRTKTATAIVQHAIAIGPCLPSDIPETTRGAFVSAAYNIGVGAFCRSSMSRRAMAGDLPGACDALLMWNRAGGREVRGLTRRREAERALCLEGLA